MYKPTFEKVAESTNIPMYTMNVEENGEYAVELGIRAVPTTKAFNNGGEVFSKPGMMSENELKGVINNIING
jgi:thioredoxin-like negative regulator of GroEL